MVIEYATISLACGTLKIDYASNRFWSGFGAKKRTLIGFCAPELGACWTLTSRRILNHPKLPLVTGSYIWGQKRKELP